MGLWMYRNQRLESFYRNERRIFIPERKVFYVILLQQVSWARISHQAYNFTFTLLRLTEKVFPLIWHFFELGTFAFLKPRNLVHLFMWWEWWFHWLWSATNSIWILCEIWHGYKYLSRHRLHNPVAIIGLVCFCRNTLNSKFEPHSTGMIKITRGCNYSKLKYLPILLI